MLRVDLMNVSMPISHKANSERPYFTIDDNVFNFPVRIPFFAHAVYSVGIFMLIMVSEMSYEFRKEL